MAQAGKTIALSILDARAHAERSITGGLIAAEDGRPTLDRAERSGPLRDALDRLDRLHDALAGPEGSSPLGLVRDAWSDAFKDSWANAREEAHPDDLADRKTPSARMRRDARQLVLEGYDARGLLAGPIENAKRTLKALVPSLASPSRRPKDRKVALDGWQATHSRAIASAVGLAIFTGAYRQDAVAQRLVLKPELLHDDPTQMKETGDDGQV